MRLKWEGQHLYMGGVWIGRVVHFSGHNHRTRGGWRAWLMTDDDGREVAFTETESAAREALEDAAREALGDEFIALVHAVADALTDVGTYTPPNYGHLCPAEAANLRIAFEPFRTPDNCVPESVMSMEDAAKILEWYKP